MSEVSKYVFELDIGRLGMTVTISAVDEKGDPEVTYESMLNGKGFIIKRTDSNNVVTELCGFSDFLYPDRIEEGEVKLIEMVVESPNKLDRPMMELSSSLISFYVAGYTEEFIWSWVDKVVSTWE